MTVTVSDEERRQQQEAMTRLCSPTHQKLVQKVDSRISEVNALQERTQRVLGGSNSRKFKYFALLDITKKMSDIVGPATPCKRGCSYCCHVAVPTTEFEAERIEEYTSRKKEALTHPPVQADPVDTLARITTNPAKYQGKPCTFLSHDGECTIYEVRPMPCRTFYVLEENAEFCDVFSGVVGLNVYNMGWLDASSSSLFFHLQIADIRDWFPDPLLREPTQST